MFRMFIVTVLLLWGIGKKAETIKSFKKKEMHLNFRLPSLHVCSFDYN